MPHRIPAQSVAARGLAIASALLVPLLAAPAAHAVTFVAEVEDAAGDAPKGSTDLREARVAYNRRSGAISVSVRMQDAIDGSGDDAVVQVLFSDLVDGRCRRPTFGAAAILSDPGGAVASSIKGGKTGKMRTGTSAIEGDTLSFRVKHRSLAGKTPGCTQVALYTNEKSEKLLDKSKGDDGFRKE